MANSSWYENLPPVGGSLMRMRMRVKELKTVVCFHIASCKIITYILSVGYIGRQ